MPRQPRLRGPDMWFHVVNRGADRQDLFHDDADFATFESLIAVAVARFGIEIHALALMTNHFHALVHSPDDVLSESFHGRLERSTERGPPGASTAQRRPGLPAAVRSGKRGDGRLGDAMSK